MLERKVTAKEKKESRGKRGMEDIEIRLISLKSVWQEANKPRDKIHPYIDKGKTLQHVQQSPLKEAERIRRQTNYLSGDTVYLEMYGLCVCVCVPCVCVCASMESRLRVLRVGFFHSWGQGTPIVLIFSEHTAVGVWRGRAPKQLCAYSKPQWV